jgi:hypothetical protein
MDCFEVHRIDALEIGLQSSEGMAQEAPLKSRVQGEEFAAAQDNPKGLFSGADA